MAGCDEVTTQPCPHCPRLEAENATLRQRIARLETSLSRARSVIEHQKRQLDITRTTCWNYIQKAGEAMAPGGLARGTWSLWKGRGEVAGHIYGQISTDFGTGMLAEIASLLGM